MSRGASNETKNYRTVIPYFPLADNFGPRPNVLPSGSLGRQGVAVVLPVHGLEWVDNDCEFTF